MHTIEYVAVHNRHSQTSRCQEVHLSLNSSYAMTETWLIIYAKVLSQQMTLKINLLHVRFICECSVMEQITMYVLPSKARIAYLLALRIDDTLLLLRRAVFTNKCIPLLYKRNRLVVPRIVIVPVMTRKTC